MALAKRALSCDGERIRRGQKVAFADGSRNEDGLVLGVIFENGCWLILTKWPTYPPIRIVRPERLTIVAWPVSEW